MCAAITCLGAPPRVNSQGSRAASEPHDAVPLQPEIGGTESPSAARFIPQEPTIPAGAIVASVGDFVVRERDLDVWWQRHDTRTYSRVRQDLYEGRRKALEVIVGDF